MCGFELHRAGELYVLSWNETGRIQVEVPLFPNFNRSRWTLNKQLIV